MVRPDLEGKWPFVDINDQHIKYLPSNLFHPNNLLHRRVAIIVYGPNGKILLKQRSLNDDTFPGLWGVSASGHVEANESYGDAAVREYLEELGHKPPSLVRRARIPIEISPCYAFTAIFTTTDARLAIPNKTEINRTEWITIEELVRRQDILTPHSREVFRAARILRV